MPDRKRNMKKQAEWSRAYNEKNYDRIYSYVPKGHKAEIQAAAKLVGESQNEFIARAIDERMAREARATPCIPPEDNWLHENCLTPEEDV